MLAPARLLAAFLLGLTAVPAPASGDEVEKQRERLQQATDVADRAKIAAKLGDALLDRMSRAFRKGRAEEGEKLLAEYREVIATAGRKLLEAKLDARHHPHGFKDLEIHIRKGERRLGDMTHNLPYEKIEVVNEIRLDLESLRRDLLTALMGVAPNPSRKGPAKEQHL